MWASQKDKHKHRDTIILSRDGRIWILSGLTSEERDDLIVLRRPGRQEKLRHVHTHLRRIPGCCRSCHAMTLLCLTLSTEPFRRARQHPRQHLARLSRVQVEMIQTRTLLLQQFHQLVGEDAFAVPSARKVSQRRPPE